MPCNINLLNTIRANQVNQSDNGGSWTFSGYSTTINGTFNNKAGYLNIGDSAGVGDNPTIDTENFDPGFYKYTYTVVDGSCTDSADLTIEVVEICAERDVNGYPIVEQEYCIDDISVSNINLNMTAQDGLCGSFISGGVWRQYRTDRYGTHGAFNPVTGILDVITLLTIQPLVNNEERTYNFYYDLSSVINYPILSPDSNDCYSCIVKVSIIFTKADIVTNTNKLNIGTYANPITYGQNFTSDNLVSQSDILNGSYNYIYYGEGPDVGGCGTNIEVETDIIEGNNVIVTGGVGANTGDKVLDLPINCGDQLTYDGGTPVQQESINIESLPSGVHAFHVCSRPKSSSCTDCQTFYISRGISYNIAEYYTEFVTPISASPDYLDSNITIESIKVNGVEQLPVPITNFTPYNVVIVDGYDYNTSLVDTLNNATGQLTFFIAIGLDCVFKHRYFSICWNSNIPFEIIISPSDMFIIAPGGPFTKVKYTHKGVEAYDSVAMTWLELEDSNLGVYNCGVGNYPLRKNIRYGGGIC